MSYTSSKYALGNILDYVERKKNLYSKNDSKRQFLPLFIMTRLWLDGLDSYRIVFYSEVFAKFCCTILSDMEFDIRATSRKLTSIDKHDQRKLFVIHSSRFFFYCLISIVLYLG